MYKALKLSILFLVIFSINVFGAERIVTVGGVVTETVFALGGGKNVIAVDKSSVYPEQVTKLPQVGYWRALPAEAVLAMRPDVLICSEETGPEQVLKQIKQAGIKVVVIPKVYNLEGAIKNINTIAEVIGKKSNSKELTEKLKKDFAKANEITKSISGSPKTLFAYIRGGKVFNAGGSNTYADAMIKTAGGTNVAADLDYWKPVSAEFFARTMPELLIVTKKGLESIGGKDYLKTQAGMSLVPAIMNNNILVVDDLAFLGFGPRSGEALIETVQAMKKINE